MSFILSKLLWPLVEPGNLIALVLLAGLAFGLRSLVLVAALALLALIATPAGAWLMAPLEARFPATEAPARVDGIIVLGGSVDARRSAALGRPVIASAPQRLTEMVRLMRLHPEARVVFTGGSGMIGDQEDKEAPVVRDVLTRLGADAGRVIFESQSRNTWENALFSRPLAEPRTGETWLLVTSAYHMPRAYGLFRRLGWPVTAYPTDFRTVPADLVKPPFDLVEGLDLATVALREWVGLAAYFAMGRLDSLFPAPQP
jgi:uncharacterized SAM-binding protein YcdF (DUF218 family)